MAGVRWGELTARLLAVAALAMVLNAIWEYAQLPLYEGGEDLPTWIMVRATAIDGVLVTGAAGVAVLVLALSRRRSWLACGVIVGVLAAVAVFIEVRAITTGRWAYDAAMPTIGVVGLSPLLQLPVTGTLSALLARPWGALRGG